MKWLKAAALLYPGKPFSVSRTVSTGRKSALFLQYRWRIGKKTKAFRLGQTFIKKWTKKNEAPSLWASKALPLTSYVGWGVITGGHATVLFWWKSNKGTVCWLQGFLLPTARVLYENDRWLQLDNSPKNTTGYKTMASRRKRARVEVTILKSDPKHSGTHDATTVPKRHHQCRRKEARVLKNVRHYDARFSTNLMCHSFTSQLESTLALTDMEEKETAKYRSVCSSDIVFVAS